MEVILPPRLKTPSASSRKTLVKDKRPMTAISGTKSMGKAGRINDKDDSNGKSLIAELNFIKDKLLRMFPDDKLNVKKVKQGKETFATKNKAASLKAKCGQSGDQKSIENVRRSRGKKSTKNPTWSSNSPDPEALKKRIKKMPASKLFQIMTYMDKKCAEWADKYKSCKHEKVQLEMCVEDLNEVQWDLQRRLNETIRDFTAFLEGKELDPSSPYGNKPLSIEDKHNPLTKKYRNLLVQNSILAEKLKEIKTEKRALLAEKTAAIEEIEEGQAFLVMNQRQQRLLKQQNGKLRRSIQEKNRLIEHIKQPLPITYNLKSYPC